MKSFAEILDEKMNYNEESLKSSQEFIDYSSKNAEPVMKRSSSSIFDLSFNPSFFSPLIHPSPPPSNSKKYKKEAQKEFFNESPPQNSEASKDSSKNKGENTQRKEKSRNVQKNAESTRNETLVLYAKFQLLDTEQKKAFNSLNHLSGYELPTKFDAKKLKKVYRKLILKYHPDHHERISDLQLKDHLRKFHLTLKAYNCLKVFFESKK